MVLVLGVIGAWGPSQADVKAPPEEIINGSDIPITDAPWQVGLVSTRLSRQYCGGSIIDAYWIVTAAHCVWNMWFLDSPDELAILAGEASLNPLPPTAKVALIITHPDYNPALYANDVALIKLAEPLPLNGTTMAPIALPTQDPATWPPVASKGFITGWGNTDVSVPNYPSDLQGAFVDILASPTTATCGQYASDQYFPWQMLCAGTVVDPLTDTCQGDSGGPLAIDVLGTWTLAGITSWGEGCAAADYPGVYTRVTSYTPWIAATMATDWAYVTGGVDTSAGSVAAGRVEFYATCQDWQRRTPVAMDSFNRWFQVTLPAGDYRVRIHPDPGEHALASWHNAASSCATAEVLTIREGTSIENLHATPGVVVSGAVSNDAGQSVAEGAVEFFATCKDWEVGKAAAQADFAGSYRVTVPAGEFRVRVVNRDTESGPVASWHSAKPTCQTASVLTVTPGLRDYSQTLVALAQAPAPVPDPGPDPQPQPTPTPPVKKDQTVKRPPAVAKTDQTMALAKRTRQNQKVTWTAKTRKVCRVSKHALRTRTSGKCRVVAQAPGAATLNAFRQVFVVRVK
jgi:hypothetical protein